MNVFQLSIVPVTQTLKAMAGWLDKAEAHAKAKNFDADVLVSARLAPDQYPLARQVQAACDAAKFLVARLSGKEAPKHPDTETTMAELKARVASCLAYVEPFKEADFTAADQKIVPLAFTPGKGLKGIDYATQLGVPNFFFHATHTYAILRHNGVDLGKMDFIPTLSLVDL